MNRAALATVIWSKGGPHVYGATCCGCHQWTFPIPIMREFSGFTGGMRIGADGKEYGFNYRFCSEICVENFKVRRMEEKWNGQNESLEYARQLFQEEKARRAQERPWKSEKDDLPERARHAAT